MIDALKNDLFKKIDAVSEDLNKRITNNAIEIRNISAVQEEEKEKLDNINIRAEENTENITDLKERLEKLEKDKRVSDLRLSEMENVIDGNEKTTPPKLKELRVDVEKMKGKNAELEVIKNDINKIKETKLSNSQVAANKQLVKQSSST